MNATAPEKPKADHNGDARPDHSDNRRGAPHKNVWEAKLAVMRKVTYLQKRKPRQGSGINYNYAAEEDFVKKLRPVLLENDLLVCPVDAQGVSDSYPTKGGQSMMQHHVVRVVYRLTHVPSGTFEDCVVEGEASDVGDKSVPKALTQAMKAFFRQCFLIETGDAEDPDECPSEEMVQVDPTKGPLGDSFVRLKRAIQQADSLERVHALAAHADPREGRKNFSDLQVSQIRGEALLATGRLMKAGVTAKAAPPTGGEN